MSSLGLTRTQLIIQKNEEEVGSGKSVGEIEGELLSSLLEMGKLLLCERIESEAENLEDKQDLGEKKTQE